VLPTIFERLPCASALISPDSAALITLKRLNPPCAFASISAIIFAIFSLFSSVVQSRRPPFVISI
jgi:hypothetical protein